MNFKSLSIKENASNASLLMAIAGGYYNGGQYDLALDNYLQCLTIQRADKTESNNNQMALACTLMCIGEVYTCKSQYKLALKFGLESLEIKKALISPNTNDLSIASSLFYIGKAYKGNSQFDLALKYFKEALEMYKITLKTANHLNISDTLINIGQVIKKENYDNKSYAIIFNFDNFYFIKT